MLRTPLLARKSPHLGWFFHAEHLYNGALFCPFESGLSMADSQAGGRVVPAQVSEALDASPSCCFPPGVLLSRRWTGRDAAFTLWTKERDPAPGGGIWPAESGSRQGEHWRWCDSPFACLPNWTLRESSLKSSHPYRPCGLRLTWAGSRSVCTMGCSALKPW